MQGSILGELTALPKLDLYFRPPAGRPPRGISAVRMGLVACLALASGCGRGAGEGRREARTAVAVPVDVMADTGRSIRFPLMPHPRARANALERVHPAPPAGGAPPLPEAPPAAAVPESPPTAASGSDRLEPPILRTPGRLTLPADAARAVRSRPLWIDLDLRVDESGAVTDAVLAEDVQDPVLMAAARRWALGMRFYPALKGGRPIAVWSRQRLRLSSDE